MKKKLITWLVILAALAALVVYVIIPLYFTSEENTLEAPVIWYYEGKAQTYTLESDELLFELDGKTTQFTVTEKASGSKWFSNPENAASDPIALASNKQVLQSTLLLTYSSASNTVELNNYAYSIENQNYTIEQPDENTLKVNYAIGKIEKTYILPIAITAERYNMFIDAMDSKTAKKVKGNYTLYDPAKLIPAATRMR